MVTCASRLCVFDNHRSLSAFGCRAPLAPIPSDYSDELHELVGALLCKDPDIRPDMEQILQMPFVRKHVEQYAQHVRTAVTKRRGSFKRSLAEYLNTAEVRALASRSAKCANIILDTPAILQNGCTPSCAFIRLM